MIVAVVLVAGALATIIVSEPWAVSPQPTQQSIDMTITGTNDCLRFLDPNVQTVYIPFYTGANEQWQLSINCTQMPGAGAWTDVYLYRGYWDNGTNNVCVSSDLYPIMSQIETTDYQLRVNNTFVQTFGESTPQSYTILFVLPPSGIGSFHIQLNKIN